MVRLANALLLVAAAAAAVASAAPSVSFATPRLPDDGWGNSWFAVVAHNTTGRDGVANPFEAQLKWYDWSIQGLREDRIFKGVASTLLILGKTSYTYSIEKQTCVKAPLPVTIVTPYWAAGEGSNYVGEEVANGVPCYVFEKLDHFYYAAKDDLGRVVRVIAPEDFQGNRIEDNYVIYEKGHIDRSIFQVPAYCP